ncbi:LysR family transcriptional regulator [Modicisalibacter radicis]|uniref:LysR family transcriptional regulator n=1 Tax=Halomonas sp. EAR18 TaxID=2518972 RepID=UPI00109D2645|nr:LysR family transcriptional regulator [Halomonas sp. EAR18]
MNPAQLRVLIAVADTGSLSRAADAVGITQSGASQALAALEDRLDVRLAVRGRRGMALTQAGMTIVERARCIQQEWMAITKIAEEARSIERGRLRLASFPSVFATLLPGLLRRFSTAHPGIQVIALEATDEEVTAWLEAGTVDVGVVASGATGGVPLYRDRWVAVTPAGHPLSRRCSGRVALSEVVTEPFVLATGGCRTHARSLARQQGLALMDVRVEVRDWASAFALVREGLGIALVPELHLPTPGEARRGLRVLELSPVIPRELALAVSPHSAGSPLVSAFVDLAAESD